MLNIIVLVKYIFDPTAIQWNYYNRQLEYVAAVFNKADLHALQWASEYKKKYGAHISVFMVIEEARVIPLERLQKFDVDQFKLIQTQKEFSQSIDTAAILAEELKAHTYDLVLCGSESEDQRTGVTPIVTAELLQIPCITQVSSIEPDGEAKWLVHRKEGRGIIRSYQIQLPILVGVTASIAKLRYIPHQSAGMNKTNYVIQDTTTPSPFQRVYKKIKVTDPQPAIHYVGMPEKQLAHDRLLSVTGLRSDKKDGKNEKRKSIPLPEFMHFVNIQLEKWLKEG